MINDEIQVGIVTIVDNNNFGNRLQNYAVQEFMKKLGVQTYTLKNEPYSNTKEHFMLRQIKNITNNDTYSKCYERKKAFLDFNRNIQFSKWRITPYSKTNKYDYIVAGSDQIWNPYINRLRDVDLLTFVEGEKRIALSASFGVENIPENICKKVSKELKLFKAISVREDRAKQIISEIAERTDTEVLVDPTLLLSMEEWEKVETRPENFGDERYVLLYFLGGISDARRDNIGKFARDNDCKIINMLDENDEMYKVGPGEFIYLINHAFFICTDSFHASVFSVIYNRPFRVFEREGNAVKMNSRIETLIRILNLKEHVYRGKLEKILSDYDYSSSYEVLKKERKRTEAFLKQALELD